MKVASRRACSVWRHICLLTTRRSSSLTFSVRSAATSFLSLFSSSTSISFTLLQWISPHRWWSPWPNKWWRLQGYPKSYLQRLIKVFCNEILCQEEFLFNLCTIGQGSVINTLMFANKSLPFLYVAVLATKLEIYNDVGVKVFLDSKTMDLDNAIWPRDVNTEL